MAQKYGWTIALGNVAPPEIPPPVATDTLERFACMPIRYYVPDDSWRPLAVGVESREFLYDGRRFREEKRMAWPKRGSRVVLKVWSRIGEVAGRDYNSFDGWTLVNGSAFVQCTDYECDAPPIAVGGIMEGGRSLHRVRCPACKRNLGYVQLSGYEDRRAKARAAAAGKLADEGTADYPRIAET